MALTAGAQLKLFRTMLTNFIFGLPEDDYDTMQETFSLMQSITRSGPTSTQPWPSRAQSCMTWLWETADPCLAPSRAARS
jgi:hypothetical protein